MRHQSCRWLSWLLAVVMRDRDSSLSVCLDYKSTSHHETIDWMRQSRHYCLVKWTKSLWVALNWIVRLAHSKWAGTIAFTRSQLSDDWPRCLWAFEWAPHATTDSIHFTAGYLLLDQRSSMNLKLMLLVWPLRRYFPINRICWHAAAMCIESNAVF